MYKISMNPSSVVALSAALLFSVRAISGATCNAPLLRSLAGAQYVVNSLHPDKPGQMRVGAVDGSEYTAGQAQWLKGQLHAVTADCQRGDSGSAAARFADVEAMLQAHHVSLPE